jgi:putative SOS response-associated peptidase YedK
MCTSYHLGDVNFRAVFDVDPPSGEWRAEVYKDYAAPIVLREDGDGRVARLATFGMVPRKHIPPGVKVFDAMNCRSESVAAKRSFSGAWRAGQLCLIACTAFYEPSYKTGEAVRWRIGMADGEPFAIAGLWRAWNEPDGTALSFTMLTANADDHPLMRRFHRPGDEKRSVIILPPSQYDEWMACKNPELARTFFRLPHEDEMFAEAAPLPPRRPSSQQMTLDGALDL